MKKETKAEVDATIRAVSAGEVTREDVVNEMMNVCKDLQDLRHLITIFGVKDEALIIAATGKLLQ
jgi:hypothetical protein